MSTKNVIATVVGTVAVGTVAMFVVSGAVYADDTSQGTFVSRVSEILGVEEEQLSSAIQQANDEGYRYGPGMHGARGPMGGVLELCTEISSEDLREALQASEGVTMGEVLSTLGVEDLDSVSECLVDEKLTHIDQMLEDGRITQDKAIEMKAEVEENMEDFGEHVVGEGPKGMHLEMGKGMGRGMHNRGYSGTAAEAGVQ